MKTGMTNAFSTHDLGESYPDLHAMLIEHGKEHDSRLGKMREITDMNVILHDPTKCLPQRKGYSKAFALAEIDQFVAGVHDGGILQAVSPQAASMITKDTNYGVRVGKQMVAIESELRANRMSRRAVAYVGHPDDLVTLQNNPQQRNDRAGEIACSCVWNFMIREDKLHMLVYTRSWDVVWGLCYDISSASAVQMMLVAPCDLAPRLRDALRARDRACIPHPATPLVGGHHCWFTISRARADEDGAWKQFHRYAVADYW